MRENLTTVAEVSGAVCVSAAAAIVALPLGLAVFGTFLIAGGYLVGRK